MASNDTDLLVTETGMFGTFTWELPEDIKVQFRGIKERHSSGDGEAMVRIIKQDVSRTVQILLLFITASLASGREGNAMMADIRAKMLEAVHKAKHPGEDT